MRVLVIFLLALTHSFSLIAAAGEVPAGDIHKALEKVSRNIALTFPEYPESALKSGTVGRVLFEFSIGKEGEPKRIEILESEPKGLFDTSVLKALEAWRFMPDPKGSFCGVTSMRSRQQIWFEIDKGVPRISLSKISDLPPLAPPTPLDVDRSKAAIAISADADDKRLVLLSNGMFKVKAGTQNFPYPKRALNAGQQGIVVAILTVLPDGAVDNVSIEYSLPAGVFDTTVMNNAKDLIIESADGRPPGRKMRACQEVTFMIRD